MTKLETLVVFLAAYLRPRSRIADRDRRVEEGLRVLYTRRLLGSLPYRFSNRPRRRSNVGVLQFVSAERRDNSLLIHSVKIRERTSLNVCSNGFVGLVDGIRAEMDD